MIFKKLFYLIAITLMMLIFCLGLLSIYRSTMKTSDWKIVNGKVESKTLFFKASPRIGKTYFIVFKVLAVNKIVPITFGSKNIEERNSVFQAIKIGNNYKFYLESNFIIFDSMKNRIQKIDFKNVELYKASSRKKLYSGIFLLVLSSIVIFLLVFYPKK